MARRVLALLSAAILAAFIIPLTACAQARPREIVSNRVDVTFRMQVRGASQTGMTFWVAYGPVAGRFAVVQLHPSGHGGYVTTRRLPLGARLTLAYLAGSGVVQKRFGPAPRDPIATVRRIASFRVVRGMAPLVRWETPVG